VLCFDVVVDGEFFRSWMMFEEPQYLTEEGLQRLRLRLEELERYELPEIAERLKQAIEDGGELNENPDYEDAKNRQAYVESEIARLKYVTRTAILIENHGPSDEVRVGSRVKIVEKGSSSAEEYILVGSAEANPAEGKISVDSPLGKALMGAKKKASVHVHAPDGAIEFIVKDIS
jgi:transcription elongation factor GreA